ncbi:MAG: uroporphyrinogen decarboxylase family protein [Clostridia bacterium]|jgi:uroporphyrinogen decarboxylase
MTERERFINCVTGKEIDRTPLVFYFGPWGETVERWKQEGIDNPNAFQNNFDLDKPPIMVNGFVHMYYYPPFKTEILERKGNLIIYRDIFGQIAQNYEGVSNIPKILKSPVNNFEEWEAFKKERLNPEDAARWPSNWPEIAEMLNNQDRPVQIGSYPCGIFGTLRDLMGVEGSLLAFYDEPELVKDIMDYLTDYWIYLFERVCKDVKVDILHIWEDMSGKQGSLISPAHIREFMLPNYRKFKDLCDKYDIPVFMVDTDGNCEELIPIFAEAGVNLMLPFEVAAGCDVVALREKYPYMAMMGGIDKREIAKGKEAIDRELERISPLLNKPGYFPALDHLIPPEVSYEDYKYFVNRLIEMIKC